MAGRYGPGLGYISPRPLELILEAVKEYTNDVRLVLPVTLSWLFGSFAKGCQTEDSDVDIAIFLDSFGNKSEEDIFIILDELAIKYRGFSFKPHFFLHNMIHSKHPFISEILETGIQIFPAPAAVLGQKRPSSPVGRRPG